MVKGDSGWQQELPPLTTGNACDAQYEGNSVIAHDLETVQAEHFCCWLASSGKACMLIWCICHLGDLSLTPPVGGDHPQHGHPRHGGSYNLVLFADACLGSD
jgi:hypothetical protein